MWEKLGVLLLACLAVGLTPAVAQQAKDATEVAPDAHRVVLDNDYVRVVEVRIGSGQKAPMHSHPARVGVSLGSGRIKFTAPDGKTELLDLRPGAVDWLEPEEHSKEVLVGTMHVILVEPKGPKPPVVARKAKDETEVAPDVARVVFENDSVRVVEARAPAGTKFPLHSHPPRVNVFLSAFRTELSCPDGRTEVVDRRPGEARWSDATEHAGEILAGTLHLVSVEVKPEPGAAPR